MFILTKLADLVQIEPKDFPPNKSFHRAIEDNINSKYANKVIQKIGLCICLYDLEAASDGLIGNGDGLVSVNVEFRLVVFRPFKGEVMIGRISSANEEGINLRTQFFGNIWVPEAHLPHGSKFARQDGCFIWHADGAELYFDSQETVRFRITGEEWFDQTPEGPKTEESDKPKTPPYRILATMEDAGLGPCLWWDGGEEEDLDEELT